MAKPSKNGSWRGHDAREFTLSAEAIPEWKAAKSALEQWLLTLALRECDGNMAAAGRRLGITKVAVFHAVRRHGLDRLTRSGA